MRTIELNLFSALHRDTMEVEDDATDDEIDEMVDDWVNDWANNFIEYSWKEKK